MEKLKASWPPSTDSKPTLKEEVLPHARTLLGCYRTGDANDPDTYVRAVTAVLSEYPIEVVKLVCDPRMGLPAKSKWLPTIYELKDACETAMAPFDRKRRELEALEARKHALSAPSFPRPTMDELKAKYGPNWGISQDDGKTPYAPTSIDELCKQAGVSREDFEAINDNAVKHRDEFLAAHPEWRQQ